MNRLILTAAVFVSAVFAQSAATPNTPEMDKALLPAPGQQKAGATIIKWKADFTYDTLWSAASWSSFTIAGSASFTP